MSDSFMHKHQASLDSQREEAEINWLFPEDDEEENLSANGHSRFLRNW